MPFLKHINSFLICIVFAILFFAGCSSSSNSIRYGSGNDYKEEKDTRFRYSNNDKEEDYENDPDISPDEVETVDVSEINQKYSSPEEVNSFSSAKERMLMEILKFVNTPYKFGGNSKNGIDCSAFTQSIFNSCSINLLRSARQQYTQGIGISDRDNLKFGDLVFFDTRKTVKPGHVGIYLNDNLFVHASSKNGVIVTPLNSNYYSERFMGARRINLSADFQ